MFIEIIKYIGAFLLGILVTLGFEVYHYIKLDKARQEKKQENDNIGV
jgi:hypothetical protein